MKTITLFNILIVVLFFTLNSYGQKLYNIESFEVLNDQSIASILTKDGESISLNFAAKVDTSTKLYADEDFCIILSRHQNSLCVSSAYKVQGKWYQDYTNRTVEYPSNGLYNIEIIEIDILDGSTLMVKYEIVSYNGKKEEVHSNLILGDKAFIDTKSGISLSYMLYARENSLRQPITSLYQKYRDNK